MCDNYRKIWENRFGKIPFDDNGRTFEIHHIDGNKSNNDINNLLCVSIQEHYEIHYKNGDYGACVMIAKRMSLPPNYISEIQKGVKRPRIGGVKKGTKPWNKGLTGYKLNLTEEGKQKQNQAKPRKISEENVRVIIKNYKDRIFIEDDRIGKTQKNGKKLTYEKAFAEYYSKIYNVTDTRILQIIKNV
jgi:hypothetical protein